MVLIIGVSPSLAVTNLLPDYTLLVYDDFGNPIAPIASRHDDFYSYSADLLTKLGYKGFNESVGSGKLDLIVYTGAGGQLNNTVVGGPFPDPLSTPSGSPTTFFSGTWGATGAYTPIAVDSVLTYLHSFDPNVNIPIFEFDMNQTGSAPDVLVSGQVRMWNTAGGQEAFWAFDNILNNAFDPAAMVASLGNIDLGVDQCINPHNGHAETCYTLDNNKGSGSLDFVAYAPTMDLSKYAGLGYTLTADFYIGNPDKNGYGVLNNGFDELYMTGNFAPSNPVPEPATLVLLGTGLLGFGLIKRKR
jgi:hypothetical protein